MTPKRLAFGETPWDGMPQATLLRETQRMYAALIATRSALAIARSQDPAGPYWGGESGTGGRALAMADSILDPLHDAYGRNGRGSEAIFRAFFRYAVDLLFSPALGYAWTACDGGCGVFIGPIRDPERTSPNDAGKPCQECARHGREFTRRPLQWSDLAKATP